MAETGRKEPVEPLSGSGDGDDDLDPVERMLKKTGCLEKHYAVQECIADTKDWRQCQKQVADFRECIESSKKTTKN